MTTAEAIQVVRLRKCKVKGCERMGRIEDYWYCREHRVWMRRYRSSASGKDKP